jgi:hypothetical protein
MQIPLQISFENAEPSEAVRAAIEREVERLEKYQHHIIGCRVAVVAPSTKHRHGAVYRINIWVTIPSTRTLLKAPVLYPQHHRRCGVLDLERARSAGISPTTHLRGSLNTPEERA